MPTIPLVDLRQQYRSLQQEIQSAIHAVFERGQFILGPEGEALEREIAAYCGTAYAVGVASGTDALELSLRACHIGPGDEVITTAVSFFATAGAIAAVGARPVFVDIDPVSYTLDPAKVQRAITPRTKAIIPVHLYGHPCDMAPLLAIARASRLRVIEDCAQAIGAAYRGRRVGSFGDAGAISFYPSKNLGAYGDGGMVVTSKADIADQVRLLRMHGSRDRVRHEVVSRNSRLDELQAAMLRVKLKYLDRWNHARRAHAEAYQRLFGQSRPDRLVLPQERPGSRHVYHLYVIRVPQRAALQQGLAKQGIASQIHYHIPLHLEPAFASLGYRRGAFPQAEELTDEALSLPLYPEMAPQDIARVAQVVARTLQLPSSRHPVVGLPSRKRKRQARPKQGKTA